MTDRLDEIDARVKAATPGKWRWLPWHIVEGNPQVRAKDKNGVEYLMCEVSSDRDAALIAHAGGTEGDLAWLLGEVRSARARAEKAEAEYSALRQRAEQLQEAERLHASIASELRDAVVISDSYGVPGSDFSSCLLCGAGGAPNVKFEHKPDCPALKAELNCCESANYWREIAEENKALRQRVEALEAVVQAARKWAQIKADFDEFDGDRRSIAEHLHEAKEELAAAVSALDARLAKQGGRDDG